MTCLTPSQQLTYLREQLTAELERENPCTDTINHVQRDIRRMEKRK